MSKQADKLEKLISNCGRFFSNFQFLLFSLSFYIIATLGTWLALLLKFDFKTATAIAYTISTGGDPYSQQKTGELGWIWWGWFFVFHVLSWLAVPVLIAAAIDSAHKFNEKSDGKAERALLGHFEEMGRDLGHSGSELDSFINSNYRSVKRLMEKE